MRTRQEAAGRRIARGLMPACLLLLAACSPAPIEMEIVESNGQHHVRLFKRGWFGMRSGETPCVGSIVLREAGTGATAWKAELAADRQCAKLERFTIGRAPAGFAETAKLDQNRLRGKHALEVWGIGEGYEDVDFGPADPPDDRASRP